MTDSRFFIMRHGETVFNASRRLQSNTMHTPLTRTGTEQAAHMGRVLREELGTNPPVTVHISETGRALQTAALICDELEIDWFDAHRSPHLVEIDMGSWCGRSYAEVTAENGPIVLDEHLLRPAPDGEDYPAIAARLSKWIDAAKDIPGDHIVVMHGISSRVLRGMMTGLPPHPEHGAPIAKSLKQGSIAEIHKGTERVLYGAETGAEHA